MKLIYTIFLILFLLPLSFAVSTVNVGSGNGGGGNNYYNVSNNNTYYNASAGFGLYANGSSMNVNSSVVQLSVNNTCSGSYAVQTILPNGSLTCVGVGGGSGGSGNITGNGIANRLPYFVNNSELSYSPWVWNQSQLNVTMPIPTDTNISNDYLTTGLISIILKGQTGANYYGNGNLLQRAYHGGTIVISGGDGGSVLSNTSYALVAKPGGLTLTDGFSGRIFNTSYTSQTLASFSAGDGIKIYTINQPALINTSVLWNYTSYAAYPVSPITIYTGSPSKSLNNNGAPSGSISIFTGTAGEVLGSTITNMRGGDAGAIIISGGKGGKGNNNTGGNGAAIQAASGNGGDGIYGGTAGLFVYAGGKGGDGTVYSGGPGTSLQYTAGKGGLGNTSAGPAGYIVLNGGYGNIGGTLNTTGGNIYLFPGLGGGNAASGNIYLTMNEYENTITGNVGIGLFSSTSQIPSASLHQNIRTATATYHKFTAGTTTGMTATDGFDVGISATGEAQLRQYENSNMTFWTNANSYMTLKNDGNLLINNLASAGNSFTCADSAGTLYDSATPCQPVTVTETDPIWTADKPNYASVVFVNSAVSALNATINAFNGAWTNSSTDVNTSLTPYINSNGANYGGYFLGNIDGNYEQSIANNNPGQYANANTCYYANISNKNTQYACIGVNGVNYSDPAYNSQAPLDSYWENSYGALHLDVANATQEISMFVGGVNQANIKINITNTTTKTYNPLTYPDDTTQYTAYAISQAHHNMRFIEFDSTTAGYTGIWVPTAIASGTAPVATAMGANHPGIVNVTANSGTAGSGYAFQQSNAGAFLLGPNYYTTTAFYIQCHTATTNITENRFGYQDIFTAAAVTDGVYWNISEINSTHYNATFSASNNTAISQGTSYNLPCNNWYMGEVYIDSPIGATGRIYRESGQVLTTQSITTNIPTSVGRETSSAVVSYLKGARYAQLGLTAYDYFEIGINATVIR